MNPVMAHRATTIWLGVLWTIFLVLVPASRAGEITPVRVVTYSADGRTVVIDDGSAAEQTRPDQVVAAYAGHRPLGWYKLTETSDLGRVCRRLGQAPIEPSVGITHAWLVNPNDVARLVPAWPADAGLFARLESIGLGASTVWLEAGTDHGVRPGDAWWACVGDQPVARFDIAYVDERVSFARVLALVSNPRLRVGQRVAQWPAPGERRLGRASTRVSYVDQGAGAPLVWIAAPPSVIATPETNVDFVRDGSFLCHGVVERGDRHFWYVRPVPLAADPAAGDGLRIGPDSAAEERSRVATTRPASQPATSPTSQPAEDREDSGDTRAVRVGDTAVIRTAADIESGRYVAHVFESTPDGYLVNAGEREGLTVGSVGRAVQVDGRVVDVRVTRVQRAYSRVRAAAGADVAVGSEVRFGGAPPVAQPVGTVSAMADETLITASLGAGLPLRQGQMLAVRAGASTVAVAVVLGTEGDVMFGYVPRCSLTAEVAPGMLLIPDIESRK